MLKMFCFSSSDDKSPWGEGIHLRRLYTTKDKRKGIKRGMESRRNEQEREGLGVWMGGREREIKTIDREKMR